MGSWVFGFRGAEGVECWRFQVTTSSLCPKSQELEGRQFPHYAPDIDLMYFLASPNKLCISVVHYSEQCLSQGHVSYSEGTCWGTCMLDSKLSTKSCEGSFETSNEAFFRPG